MKISFIVIAFGAIMAAAQGDSTPPACAVTCATNSSQGNSCSPTDIPCLCANTDFQRAVLTCLQTTCSGDDLQKAIGFAATTCNIPSASLSSIIASFTAKPGNGTSTPGGNTTTSPTAGASGSATPTGAGAPGAAANLVVPGSLVLGALFGGLLVM